MSRAERLLLVGWDAADWKILHPLIDAGQMPALRRIVEEGVSGEMLCTQPLVSAMQWTSMATGKRAWQHCVTHPLEPAAGGAGAVPVSASRRRARAIWEILAQEGRRAHVVGWPATHNSQGPNLCVVSDRYAEPTAPPGIQPWPPAAAGTYSPERIRSALDPLRMSPEGIQADVISRLVPGWRKIDQKRDRRLGQLRLFLATDFSCQTALVKLLAGGDWNFAAVRFPALGAISQVFLSFHPPRPGNVSEEEFALYRDVINQCCVMLDRLLHDLLRAAGGQTAVLVTSAHGVRRVDAPGIRPRADNTAGWKSPYGIFAASGPGIARDALVFGAGVLDIVPTVLTWFGLPIGDDMEGRVLVESFAEPPSISRVTTWEITPPPSVSPAEPAGALDSPGGQTALERESDWNLAQACLDAGHHEEALPALKRLFWGFPERADFAHALFQCQLSLRLLPEAQETLGILLEIIPAGILALLPQAELSLARGDTRQARALVEQALRVNNNHPDSMRRLGLLLLRLRDWHALLQLATRALELDGNEPVAWLGLAEAQLRKGNPAEAEAAAVRAIGLRYFFPQAHFVLARALVAQSKWHQARETMQTLMRLQPNNRSASAYYQRMEQKQGDG